MEKILLLMGTNLGNLETNLTNALNELENNDIKILKKSKIYRTKPWGRIDQPDFLNMGLEVRCDHKPLELIRLLKQIEVKMGRKPDGVQWGPRTIDIDIVFYGSQIIRTKELTIPHASFFKRPFAIKVLSEIAPDFVPPCSDKKLKDCLSGVEHEGSEIYYG